MASTGLPESLRRWVYDQEQLVFEYEAATGTNVLLASVKHGPRIDEPWILELVGDGPYYHFGDSLGSVTDVLDITGMPVTTNYYRAFGSCDLGACHVGFADPYTYTAREDDTATALLYYRARYYDAKTGRFLSEDPVGFAVNGNLYTYVRNRSTTAKDPSGLSPVHMIPEFPSAHPTLSSQTACLLDAYNRFVENPRLGLGQEHYGWGPIGNAVYVATLGNRGSSCVAYSVGLSVALNQAACGPSCTATEQQTWFPLPHSSVLVSCECTAASGCEFTDYYENPANPAHIHIPLDAFYDW